MGDTWYLASYDVESVRCLGGVERIVGHHKRHGVGATFFVVGELLEDRAWAGELKALLEDPFFDIQNHSYSHIRLKFGRDADGDFLRTLDSELVHTNELIGALFGRAPTGFRTPMGFSGGLRGESGILNVLWKNGIRFVSSLVVGEFNTVPAPLREPFYYEVEDILHPILELPAHGWHDNVLKGYNFCPVLWPPLYSFGYPASEPRTPEDEYAVWKSWLDYAVEKRSRYFAPIFHPWSVRRFDETARTIDLLLAELGARGIQARTYAEAHQTLSVEIPV